MPAGLDAAGADAGLGVGQVGQQALAVFQKGAALVGERDASRGAHHELDAQARLQPVEPATDDGRRHPFGLGRGGEAAARGHGHKGFELLELVHGAADYRIKAG